MRYYFECCECKKKSDYLGKDDYMRLQKGTGWLCNQCFDEVKYTKIKEYLNGFIIEKEEF